jgi:DNA repair exonuclease SbcCD ATPase subunit
MATAPIMMETVPFAEKKNGIVTSVHEIPEEIQPAILVKFQPATFVPSPVFKEFQCEWPTVDANVNRVQEPLPFPSKLKDLIAWTDAFVDRIAVLTGEEEQKTLREKAALQAKVNSLKTELEKTRKDRQTAIDRRAEAEREGNEFERKLKAALKENKAHEQTIKNLEEKEKNARIENSKLLKKNSELATKYEFVRKANIELKKKLADVSEDYEEVSALHDFDHEALEKEHKLYDEEHKKRVTAEKELSETRTKLATAETKVDSLKTEVKDLKTKFATATEFNAKLEGDVARLSKGLAASEASLNEAKITIDGLKTVIEVGREHIAKLEQDKKKAEEGLATLQGTVKTLEAEKKLIDDKLAVAQVKLAESEEQLATKVQVLNRQIEEKREAEKLSAELRAELDEATAELRKAEDKKRKAEDRLSEAEKALTKEKNGQHDALEAANKTIAKLTGGKGVKPLNITKVQYGPLNYTDILNKIYKHAENGTTFKADNKFFVADPDRGVFKYWSIDYEVDGKPFHLEGPEHGDVKIDLKKK